MAPAHSQPSTTLDLVRQALFGSRNKQLVTASVLLTVLSLVVIRTGRPHSINMKLKPEKKKGKGDVDSIFWQRIKFLTSIVIPDLWCG
jgi:hypothetical protein